MAIQVQPQLLEGSPHLAEIIQSSGGDKTKAIDTLGKYLKKLRDPAFVRHMNEMGRSGVDWYAETGGLLHQLFGTREEYIDKPVERAAWVLAGASPNKPVEQDLENLVQGWHWAHEEMRRKGRPLTFIEIKAAISSHAGETAASKNEWSGSSADANRIAQALSAPSKVLDDISPDQNGVPHVLNILGVHGFKGARKVNSFAPNIIAGTTRWKVIHGLEDPKELETPKYNLFDKLGTIDTHTGLIQAPRIGKRLAVTPMGTSPWGYAAHNYMNLDVSNQMGVSPSRGQAKGWWTKKALETARQRAFGGHQVFTPEENRITSLQADVGSNRLMATLTALQFSPDEFSTNTRKFILAHPQHFGSIQDVYEQAKAQREALEKMPNSPIATTQEEQEVAQEMLAQAPKAHVHNVKDVLNPPVSKVTEPGYTQGRVRERRAGQPKRYSNFGLDPESQDRFDRIKALLEHIKPEGLHVKWDLMDQPKWKATIGPRMIGAKLMQGAHLQDPWNNSVYLYFGWRSPYTKDKGVRGIDRSMIADEIEPDTNRPHAHLEEGGLAFARTMRSLVEKAKEIGLPLTMTADGPHARAYHHILTQAGYNKVGEYHYNSQNGILKGEATQPRVDPSEVRFYRYHPPVVQFAKNRNRMFLKFPGKGAGQVNQITGDIDPPEGFSSWESYWDHRYQMALAQQQEIAGPGYMMTDRGPSTEATAQPQAQVNKGPGGRSPFPVDAAKKALEEYGGRQAAPPSRTPKPRTKAKHKGPPIKLRGPWQYSRAEDGSTHFEESKATCENCGKEYPGDPESHGFCSDECKREFHQDFKDTPEIKKGGDPFKYAREDMVGQYGVEDSEPAQRQKLLAALEQHKKTKDWDMLPAVADLINGAGIPEDHILYHYPKTNPIRVSHVLSYWRGGRQPGGPDNPQGQDFETIKKSSHGKWPSMWAQELINYLRHGPLESEEGREGYPHQYAKGDGGPGEPESQPQKPLWTYHEGVKGLLDDHVRNQTRAHLGALADALDDTNYEETPHAPGEPSFDKQSVMRFLRQGDYHQNYMNWPLYVAHQLHAYVFNTPEAMQLYHRRIAQLRAANQEPHVPGREARPELSDLSQRMQYSKREDGSIQQPSMISVSPNTEDNQPHEAALRNMSSQNFQAFRKKVDSIRKQVGLQGTSQPALGDWTDGAEESVLQLLHHSQNPDQVRYLAAWYGLLGDQKSVLMFHPNYRGSDSTYHVDIPNTDLMSVRKGLDQAGIPFRTLVPKDKGTQVVVYDKDRKLRPQMAKFAGAYNARIDEAIGTGEFVGGSTRAEARHNYRKVIDSYEGSATAQSLTSRTNPPGPFQAGSTPPTGGPARYSHIQQNETATHHSGGCSSSRRLAGQPQ